MALELLGSVTDFTPINGNINIDADSCTSIAFQNNSSDDYDTSGNSVGYRMVINNQWQVLPGREFAISQAIGFADKTQYRITFKAVTGTPGTATKSGVVLRVNTLPKCGK